MNGTRETIERWNAAGERLLRELNARRDDKVAVSVKAVLRRELARQRRRLVCLGAAAEKESGDVSEQPPATLL